MQPLHTVVEMEQFSSSAKRASVTEDEIGRIISELAKNPTTGQVIAGTGGARKFRYRGRGKGKSGGYRVVTFFTGDDMPVFLIDIFAKGDRINLSKSERNHLKSILSKIAEAYKRDRP